MVLLAARVKALERHRSVVEKEHRRVLVVLVEGTLLEDELRPARELTLPNDLDSVLLDKASQVEMLDGVVVAPIGLGGLGVLVRHLSDVRHIVLLELVGNEQK